MNIRNFTMKGSNLPNLNMSGVNISHFKPVDQNTAMNDARASLSSSTDNRKNWFQQAYGGYSQATQDITQGIAKGEATTATGLGTIVSKGLGKIPGPIGKFFQGGAQQGQEIMKSPELQPKGIAQNIGYGGERVAEFFAPGGAEKGIASKVAPIAESVGGLGEGLIKTATKAATTGLSTAGVTAAQTGGDMSQVKSAGTFGAVAGGLGQALESFAQPLAKALNKADFKLSPAAEAKASQKADAAAQFITDNKVVGSDETKYTKLVDINKDMENTIQQTKIPIPISKQNIIDDINQRVESLRTKDPAIYKASRSQADEAIGLLKSQKGQFMNFEDALSGKRSYGQQAFKTTKYAVKDPRVVSEGSYAVEQGYQKGIEDAMNNTDTKISLPSKLQGMFGGAKEVTMKDFNKVYSQAITAKNLMGLSRFKSDTGLLGRFFGLWVGESIGQAISPGLGGKFVGATAGELSSTHIPSLVRNIGERAIEQSGAIPTVAKAGLGLSSRPKNQ